MNIGYPTSQNSIDTAALPSYGTTFICV